MQHKDFSINSGERQIGQSLLDIRRDHIARYELVELLMREHANGEQHTCLDVFCGNGYGTYMLADLFPSAYVVGVDGCKEAIDMANECYSLPNNLFSWKLFPFAIPVESYDVVVCFESLEHVEDDRRMLELILGSLKKDGIAVVSVPNQDEHPLDKNPHKFHFRHYSHTDFIEMIPQPFFIKSWYGQNVYKFSLDGVNTFQLLPEPEMCLRKNVSGQVNIYVISRRGQE